MRNLLIAGNWKMNNTISEAMELITAINATFKEPIPNVKVLVCPAFINLLKVKEIASGSQIHVGAQNCYSEPKGAYTGEVSVNMLKAVGCEYIIVGHSERRDIFVESNDFINKKIKLILEKGITPILCIGEKLETRKAGTTSKWLKEQLDGSLAGIEVDDIAKIVIAYEPVWAIGTGVSATCQEVEETHNWIRQYLTEKYGDFIAGQVLLLYGGSLNEKNAPEILSIENVDGGLIGGASLKADSFLSIINTAGQIQSKQLQKPPCSCN